MAVNGWETAPAAHCPAGGPGDPLALTLEGAYGNITSVDPVITGRASPARKAWHTYRIGGH